MAHPPYGVTVIGDVLVTTTDALGHLASDLVVLSRPEIAEVSEPAGEGRGGSSTMPQKRNPVLAVLIRRAAATAPLLGSQLHLASAQAVDERPEGAWHTEWQPLALLARHAVTAASQAAELLEGLEVHADAMAATVQRAMPGLLAERASIRALTGRPAEAADPSDYLGATQSIIDATLERALRTGTQR